MRFASQDDVDLVKVSGLFDEPWYLDRYQDVRMLGMDPIEHYLWLGAKMGRDPSARFSTKGYLALHDDVASSGINPFIHYIRHGREEGRVPSGDKILLTVFNRNRRKDGVTRTAIFAMYTIDGVVSKKIEWYLSGLAEVVDNVIVVADQALSSRALGALKRFTPHVLATRHGEYDFGSYKRGIDLAIKLRMLQKTDELILCNDSCFAPIDSFVPMVQAMSSRDVDFWGVTACSWPKQHLQSYFLSFNKTAFSSPAFSHFFSTIKQEQDVKSVVLKYEANFTGILSDAGLKWDAFVSPTNPRSSHLNINPVHNPVRLLKADCPLVKVKACNKLSSNDDGMPELLHEIKRRSSDMAAIISNESIIDRFKAAPKVAFSIIMPVHNRPALAANAIDSVLSQSHQNYELIVVDDFSTDGTREIIEDRYAAQIASGKIVFHKLAQKGGVSIARNEGLRLARNPWIAYVDSDNTIIPGFLTTFASAIISNPYMDTFTARWRLHSNGTVRGSKYERLKLERGNYIDLGVFVHRRELVAKYGPFDANLKRLVDWDLILRLTKDKEPVFVDKPVMVYWDDETDSSRISVRESLDVATQKVRMKNGIRPRISTIIPTYNHQDFILAAIESAVRQEGDFDHEIIVCSDGSNDKTPTIIANYARENPGVIRNLSLSANNGISETFRRCIAASTGDYIAILEGDDIWTDNQKLKKQMSFLHENIDCSMVFSKISVKRLPSGKETLLPRQNNLKKDKLDGSDFLADESMNLIANFSCCMFRSHVMKNAPSRLFEGRFNEIAVAFYLERHGKIGFINEALSIYHQHEKGVWTGSSREQQLISGIETREMVADVAHPRYRSSILEIIETRYKKPLSELERSRA